MWGVLTIWAEMLGAEKYWTFSPAGAEQSALIVYDPDPFYNLDEQVCKAFAEALEKENIYATVATVSALKKRDMPGQDLYVFCANTYNWRPDWAVSGYIKKSDLKNKKVVAITLGSGSTKAAKKALEKILINKEADLIGSRTFWLMRPNDESRMEEGNVEIAVDMVGDWVVEIAAQLNNKSTLNEYTGK